VARSKCVRGGRRAHSPSPPSLVNLSTAHFCDTNAPYLVTEILTPLYFGARNATSEFSAAKIDLSSIPSTPAVAPSRLREHNHTKSTRIAFHVSLSPLQLLDGYRNAATTAWQHHKSPFSPVRPKSLLMSSFRLQRPTQQNGSRYFTTSTCLTITHRSTRILFVLKSRLGLPLCRTLYNRLWTL
jgi:hypothetical protein